MRRLTNMMLLAGLLVAPAACGRESNPSASGAGAAADSGAQHSATAAGTEAGHGAAPAHAGDEGLPLRPIMLQLADDMAGLSQAIWVADYPQMVERSRAIAEHPHVLAEELRRVERALGTDMAAFEEADELVHAAAARLHEAAQARQIDAVLEQFATLQRGCVACHMRFQDRLRTTAQ
jgi:hypothetical protein